MISLIDLLLPNLAETGLGLIYLVVAVLVFIAGRFIKLPLLDRILNVVALGFLLFGLFTIFAISFINDILANRNLTLVVAGIIIVGVIYYVLFMEKKKRKR